MLQVYVLNVSAVFKRILQVVYLDVAYVALVIYVRCKCMFSAVANVCCKCFIKTLHMLQWAYTYAASVCFQMFKLFQTYVASILSGYYICCSDYTHILQVFVLNVLSVFIRMLQQMLYVASVPGAGVESWRRRSKWSPRAQRSRVCT
jgi:hypothetical protein